MGLGKRIAIGFAVAAAVIGAADIALVATGNMSFVFRVHDGGSGISFSKEFANKYKIKKLGIEIEGNTFYNDDYFYSKKYGTKYAVSIMNFMPVGNLYLAEKSKVYNSEKFVIDLSARNNQVIHITDNMNYVKLIQSGNTSSNNIYIEKRDTPLDLTLENVNFSSVKGFPAIMSETVSSINMKLVGTNSIKASDQPYTNNQFLRLLEDRSNEYVQTYSSVLKYVGNTLGDDLKEIFSDSTLAHKYETVALSFANAEIKLMETIWFGIGDMIMGKDGDKGKDGSPAILHFGGISFTGSGSVSLTGGKGAGGGDASFSLTGSADGGYGGDGASAVITPTILEFTDRVSYHCGSGGPGGKAKKILGIFNGSGNDGGSGKDATQPVICDFHHTNN